MFQKKKTREIFFILLGSIIFTFYFVNQYNSQTSVYELLDKHRSTIQERHFSSIYNDEESNAQLLHNNKTNRTDGLKFEYKPPLYIIWTRWRCGSSFLGRLMSMAKSNIFYSYEPLHQFGLAVMKKKDERTKFAIKFLVDLMNCKYEGYEKFVDYFMRTDFYYTYNPLTSKMCDPPVPECNSTKLLSDKCKQSDTQIVKLLRLSLAYGDGFLDYNPNVKIIYLVRDPRPTMKSRSRLLWCLLKDCHDPKRVCDLLEDDMSYAVELIKKYPQRFMFMRYEDLALKPKETFSKVWNFLGENYSPEIDQLIDNHTLVDAEKGTYALHKNSKRNVFAWRSSLDILSLDKIQRNCASVMGKLGYYSYNSEEEYDNTSISPIIEGAIPFVKNIYNTNSDNLI